MEQRKRLNEKSRRAYVEGMKRYQEQGVRVLIDGKDADDELWEKIFEIRKDGGFYMGDYILEEVPAPGPAPVRDVEQRPKQEEARPEQPNLVRDVSVEYGAADGAEAGTKRKLKEIRFDIVYHR